MAITGTGTGVEGATVPVSSPFQVANCNRLQTIARNSLKQNEEPQRKRKSRHVKLVPPHEGPQSTGATNASGTGTGTSGSCIGIIGSNRGSKHCSCQGRPPKAAPVEVDYIAEGMHSRPVFDTNPAACPAASVVASAKAITPILPVPTSRQGSNLGPAYFVSHGNEAFPQLILVLQGYGITIDLVGDTFISKSGITSSTFAHVPDAPVSSFELTLPQGKYSALTANANLCTVKGGLKMPTEFVGQNGAVIHQSTPISVSGCPKVHKAKHKAKKKSKKHSKSKGKKK